MGKQLAAALTDAPDPQAASDSTLTVDIDGRSIQVTSSLLRSRCIRFAFSVGKLA